MDNFSWEKYWEEEPSKNKHNILWANLRPSNYKYEEAYKHIDKLIKFDSMDYVLEIGCGTGELLKIITPNVQVVMGSDASRSMVNIAQERNNKNLIVRAPMHNLPFTDQSFDKIIMMGVIQYVSKEYFTQSLKELLRLLKKNGKIIIGDILEVAPEESLVAGYPKNYWRELGIKSIKIEKSYFEQEKRYDLIISN